GCLIDHLRHVIAKHLGPQVPEGYRSGKIPLDFNHRRIPSHVQTQVESFRQIAPELPRWRTFVLTIVVFESFGERIIHGGTLQTKFSRNNQGSAKGWTREIF